MKTILMIALLTLIGITNAELILFPYPDTQLFPLGIYFLLALFTLFLFFYLWIDYRFNNSFHRFEWILIALLVFPILALLIGTPSIAVSTLNPALITNPSIFNPTPVKLFQSLFYGLSIPMVIYVLYFFSKRDTQINSVFNFIVFGAIFFVFIEIAYSLIVEWDEYLILFEGYENGASITSFTTSPNVFAFNLSMGLYGSVMLFVKEKKFKVLYLFLIVFLYAFIVVTMRRLVFLSTTLFLIPLLLFGIYFLFKQKVRYIVLSLLSLSLIVGLFLVFGLGNINLPFSELIEIFTNPNAALSTVERLEIWITGLSLFTNHNQLTGYGFGLSNVYLALAFALPVDELGGYVIIHDRFHNGFLEILVSYGLIGTLLLTIAHWEYFKALIQLTKRYWIAIPMWALIISFAVQMMFEDRILFRPDLSGIFFMTMLILPLVKPEAFSKELIKNKTNKSTI